MAVAATQDSTFDRREGGAQVTWDDEFEMACFFMTSQNDIAKIAPDTSECRLVIHVSLTFARLLVKFIGTHAEYDRIDPETVSWRQK